MPQSLFFPLMLLCSALLHALVLLSPSELQAIAAGASQPEMVSTRVVFSQAVASTPEVEQTLDSITPQEQQPQKQRPQKHETKKSEPSTKPTPPPLVKENPAESKPLADAVLETVAAATIPPDALPQPGAAIVTDENEIKRYIALLLAHIERHKLYPPMARKRAIEGQVTMLLSVSKAGGLLSLEAHGGPKILRVAAIRTVNDALPFPTPPALPERQLEVNYRMEFTLK